MTKYLGFLIVGFLTVTSCQTKKEEKKEDKKPYKKKDVISEERRRRIEETMRGASGRERQYAKERRMAIKIQKIVRGNQIPFKVMTMSGESIDVVVTRSGMISDLKRKIEKAGGPPQGNQQIFAEGVDEPLADTTVLQTLIGRNLFLLIAERTPQIAAGGNHTCAIKESGELSCWGEDQNGQTTVPADLR